MSSFSWKAWHPKQHRNRCLNHSSPLAAVISLKAHAFHFPINYRWEHLAFSRFIFPLSYQNFLDSLLLAPRFPALVADLLRHEETPAAWSQLPSHVCSRHLEFEVRLCILISLQRKLQAPSKAITGSWQCLSPYTKALEKHFTPNMNFVTQNWHQNISNML